MRLRRDASCVVAVVGVGAVGVSLVAQLCDDLRESGERNVQILAFDHTGHFGTGVAYQMDLSQVLLNRTAANMSVRQEQPTHFAAWLLRMGHPVQSADDHVPRAVFGHYLQDTLRRTIADAAEHGVNVVVNSQRIDRVAPCEQGYLVFSGADCWRVDRVVLCTGSLRSRHYEHLQGSPGYHASAYPLCDLVAEIPSRASVGVIGSRLSAVDVVVNLRERGHRGLLTLLSRQGWLPCVQGGAQPAWSLRYCTLERIARLRRQQGGRLRYSTVIRLVLKELSLSCGERFSVKAHKPTCADAVELLRRDIIESSVTPQPWQAAFVALNSVIADLWDALSDDDKRRFRQHDFSRFMALRVPIPLSNAERMLTLFDNGIMRIQDKLLQVQADSAGFIATIQQSSDQRFDVIVNCTSAENDLSHTEDPLYRVMVHEGLLRSHELGGVDVDFQTSEAIRADGSALKGVYVVGSLTMGKHFFCSVLELNVRKSRLISRKISDYIIQARLTQPTALA